MPHHIKEILEDCTPRGVIPAEEEALLRGAHSGGAVNGSNRGLMSRREVLGEEVTSIQYGLDTPITVTRFIGFTLGLRATDRGLRVGQLEDDGFCFAGDAIERLEAAREERCEAIRQALSRRRPPGEVLREQMEDIITPPSPEAALGLSHREPTEELETLLGASIEIRAGMLELQALPT